MQYLRIISVFFLSCFISDFAIAQGTSSCCSVPGWTYVKNIKYNNSGNPAYTNYQILLVLDTETPISQGKMRPDGSDIRFSDSKCGSFIPYWIEGGINTTKTEIWVLAPYLPANDTDIIYMYYGNAAATPMSSFPSVFTNVLIVTGTDTLNGLQTAEWIDIQATGAIFTDSAVSFKARKIIVTGGVNADFVGYAPAAGPGAGGNGGGWVGGGGAGYGGMGGDGGGVQGYSGTTYGTPDGMDIDMGSGGGGSDCLASAGGGGVIKMEAASIEVDGMLLARGGNAPFCCCLDYSEAAGGGSGGGILLYADYIEGTGRLSAKGGLGGESDTKEGGGGGGGGRIKLFSAFSNTFSGITNVVGGLNGLGHNGQGSQSNPHPGQPGTVARIDLPDYIAISPERLIQVFPVSGFTYSTCSNPVSFNDLTTIADGSVIGWHWDFGDSITSMQQSPSHNYNPEGTYTVTLTTTSDSGCTNTYTQPVNAFSPPVASFTTADVCYGTAVNFTDASTVIPPSVITTWHWNFGDGQTASQQHSAHQYAAAGVYNVILKVTTNNNCSHADTQQVTVFPIPVADFSAADVCAGAAVNFDDASTIQSPFTITSWSWDFGDSTASAQRSLAHQYAAEGTYTARLTISTGTNCTQTVTHTVTVHPFPVADFNIADECLGTPVRCVNASSVDLPSTIRTFAWDFGDGATSIQQNPQHDYATEGTYITQLIVNANNNCADTATRPVTVYPTITPSFTANNVCLGASVNFADASSVNAPFNITSWLWNFGDGTTSTRQHPAHVYMNAGTYTATLAVSTDSMCTQRATRQVTIYPVPVAEFTAADVCLGTPVLFTNASSPATVSSAWNFGDGNSSSVQHPVNSYAAAGSYPVTLVVATANCSDTLTQAVNVFPAVGVSLTATDVRCAGENTGTINATPSGGTPTFSYQWSTGATTQNLRNLSGGIYSITVTDAHNCIATGTATVAEPAEALSVIEELDNIRCFGEENGSINLSVSGGTGPYEYDWSNYAGTSAINALPAGTYIVTVTDNNGCSFTGTYTLTEPHAWTLSVFPPDTTVFFGAPVQFHSIITPANTNMQYTWHPSNFLSCDNCPHPQMFAHDSMTYYITAEDANNCVSLDTVKVGVDFDKVLYIPNAFTPNGDGTNDVFYIYTYGDKRIKMRIFDRWGSLIFTSDDKRHGWDGTSHGVRVNPGVFVYDVFVEYLDHTFDRANGSVTVIE